MRVTEIRSAQMDLIAKLRKQPDDIDSRMQLFRFAVIDGNWERAASQLDIVSRLDASMTHTAMVYQRNIASERFRLRVFAGEQTPVFLGEPPPWLGYLVQALQEDEKTGAALALQALEQATAISGSVNDQAFSWLADADSRLGPVLEAYIDGKYYWVPFEHLTQIILQEPEDLLDLAWEPCEITLANGGVCKGFIPTRYPATDPSVPDDLKLARLTKMHPWSDTLQKGLGQRMLVSDREEYALLDCRTIRFQNSLSGNAP